ncbi:hypothetical protein [Gordonia westfalica]|uniref:Uncharacterized protein n=1 Tax=Gordonia westfalica TaxID=158898 RepID=A0A1H2IPR2_9ACTN|nr:hypothetical protein [Gordonia westfalica]SDU46157.1 hypothetical protein SAMN04488548_1341344 [Gordonia westfalica]
MTLFWIAVPVAIVIAVLYIAHMVTEFRHLRSGADSGVATEPVSAVGSFAVKAVVGVLASTSFLLLISYTSWGWYLLPVLSMGSAVAVIAAFRLDAKSHPAEPKPTETTEIVTVEQ